MRDFLAAIWGDLDGRFGEIRPIKGGVVRQSYHTSPETAESDALVLNALGHDVYYGVLPRNEKDGKGSAIDDVTSVMWADFDSKAYPRGKSQAFQAMASVAPQAQIVVDSGNGYHAYWLLDELEMFDEVRDVMKGMALMVGSDKAATDKARILRVPGTDNYKTDPPNPVRLLRFDTMARRHRLSDFVQYAEAVFAPPPAVDRTAVTTVGVDGWDPSSPRAPKFPEGQRNNELTRVAGIMFARGMSGSDVEQALWHENLARCNPPLEANEVQAIVNSVGRYAR